jgi:ribonucleoside-triphosphate reductase
MAEATLEKTDCMVSRIKEEVTPLERDVKVIKKDGTVEDYHIEKIIVAVNKSATRVLVNLEEKDFIQICDFVANKINNMGVNTITMLEMHSLVECALQQIDPQVALSYRNYRNYKQDFVGMLDKVFQESQRIMYLGDKENSNIDSTLVATKRSLTYNELSKELYKKFFLTKAELQAVNDGYIYVHDMSARLNTMNCFSRDTRFITSEGVKSFYDFNDGDKVIVLTHDGSWQNAVVKCFGAQKLNKVVFKRGAKGDKVVRVTPNHRWLLKDGTETAKLKVGDKLILTPDIASFDWDTLTQEQKKLWVYGFCMADGFTQQNSENSWFSTIRLFGRKMDFAPLFEDAGFTVTQPKCLDGAYSVHVPSFRKDHFDPTLIDYKDMVYYVNGYLSADGNKTLGMNNSSPYNGVQVTGSNNKYMGDILNVAGYYVTTTKDFTGQITNYGVREKETKHYGFYSNQGCRGWVVQSITEDTVEDVWCLVVENSHSFILENGIVTGNCCLFNIGNVLKGGFEMGNIWYNEPKSLETAFAVAADIVMSASAQQYGGFTLPEIDKVLAPYAEKSFETYFNEAMELCNNDETTAYNYAMKKVQRDFEQGFQQWEYKFNTVGSSRGDYPFITVTSGLSQSDFGIMCNKAMLKVRMEGQGKKENKKPVLFPKIVFLYDKNLHGEGGKLREVYDAGIACSQKAMYPDWLSMTGEGYIASMYKKYKKVISPMGCRAFLSPWYERGGMKPADENDVPVFEGRFNIGAVSLHLPMILMKAREEGKDFYTVLDYYMEMIRGLHIRTYKYLGDMKASVNPLAFCEGGFYGGNLGYNEKIAPALKSATASFGITALNELQRLYNGKSIREDGEFALEVMEYINKKVSEFKEQDGYLYAIYGTPAESLAEKQVYQFRNKYGVIENVSDKLYVSNSFHCHVTEDMTPIEKQDKEKRFWELLNGGKIQYVKYPISYNKKAVETLVDRAMELGFYEGVNLSLSYCDDCGHEELNMDVCPKCGSTNLTKIERMNGYLSYSRVKGDTRLNKGKMEEIKSRVSM